MTRHVLSSKRRAPRPLRSACICRREFHFRSIVENCTDIFPRRVLHLGFVHPFLSCARLPPRLFGLDGVHVGESPVQVDNVGVFNLQYSYQRHNAAPRARVDASPPSLSTRYLRGERICSSGRKVRPACSCLQKHLKSNGFARSRCIRWPFVVTCRPGAHR